MRRYDQRNMSDITFSICSIFISNIAGKDRAKDVEQFDDILCGRSSITQTSSKTRLRPGW